MNRCSFSALLLIVATVIYSSNLETQIDDLLTPHVNGPGWAVGVVRDGALIFAKGYGKADLEQDTPITPQSVFYMASASKQFAAACAAILIQRQKLDPNEEIRRYLPEMPVYETPVTVGDLIYHTSGIREYTSLLLFAGDDPDFERAYTNTDLVQLAARQVALNFEPGSAYRYSSLNYILLTEIIERITNKNLNDFAREVLFDPLKMHDTAFEADHHRLVPRRVRSYRKRGETFQRYVKSFDAYGDGGLLTTVEDLAKWDAAFYRPLVGEPGWAAMMTRPGILRNGPRTGEKVNYAMGLQFREVYGRQAVEHNGGMLGFTVDLVRFPEEKLSVIVLGNAFQAWSTALAYQIAGLMLNPSTPSPDIPPKSITMSTEQLKRLEGRYASTTRNFYRRVILAPDDTLRFDWGDGDGSSGERLWPVGDGRFVIQKSVNGWMTTAQQTMTIDEQSGRATWVSSSGEIHELQRYDPTPPASLSELTSLVGTYVSTELRTTYRFTIEQERFLMRINDAAPKELFPKPAQGVIWNAKDRVWIGFGQIRFINDKGTIVGFHLGDRRVNGVRFEKE